MFTSPIKRLTPILLALLLLILWICRLSDPAYAQAPHQSAQEEKQILFLNPFEPSAPAVIKIDEGLSVALESGGIPGVNQFFESLDLRRNPDPEHRKFQVEQMRIRYGHRDIDMIITMYPEALEFVLKDCRELFADVPILALYLPPSLNLPKSSHRIIRHSPYYDIAGTVEIALKLMPEAKRVYIVSGIHEVDKWGEDQARRDLVKWEGRLEFHYLSRLSFEEMLATLSTAPARSFVLLVSFSQDTAGRFYLAPNLTKRLNQVSAAPIFGLIGTALDHGIVGGNLIDFKLIGNRAGDLVLTHFKGIPLPETVSQVLSVPSVPMFDWLQLRKWKLSESALPKDSIVINRQTTFWDFKYYIVGCLVFCLVQSLLIVGLLLQRRLRKAMQKEIQNAADEWRTTFDSVQDLVMIVEPEFKIIRVNAAASAFFDLPFEKVVGKPYYALLYGTSEPLAACPLIKMLRTKRHEEAELYDEKKGAWLQVSADPVVNDKGEILRAIQTVKDVTEHKRAEEAVRQANAYNRSLIEASLDPLVTIGPNGKITDVNAATEAVTGCARAELIGTDFSDYFTDPSKAGAGYQQVFREGFVRDYPLELRRHDGSVISVLYNASVYRNESGRVAGVFAAARDITERKRAEDALSASEARLRGIFENVQDGCFQADLSGLLTFASPSAASMYGYDSGQEMIGVPAEVLYADARNRASLLADLRGLGRVTDRIVQGRRKDGRTLWVSMNVQFCRNESGQIVGTEGFVRNITERRQAEAEREKLWAQLSQAQKMESIGRLAGGVAHDFGNILSTMMLQIDVAIASPDVDPLIKRTFEELQTQAEGAASLIQQLLQFSRRSVVIQKTQDLNKVVANVVKMVGRLIGENINLRFKPMQVAATVNADVGMIEQVIMNLAINARDAMPNGGSLAISIESVDVDEKDAKDRPEARPGRFICLSVSDTGCGMDEDTLRHIFEPFFTTKEPGKGTGLGLSTVHGIVGQHKGWVEAESEVGNGSTFRVFLPAGVEGESVETEQSEKGSAMQGSEIILLVEDAAKLREMIAESLRLLGYRVIEAGNGEEAMKKWQENHEQIDMLLSDVVLPGQLSGLQLLEIFRDSKPSLKVILSSSYSAEMVDDGRLSTESMAYLRKPYRIETMSKMIRDCFGKG